MTQRVENVVAISAVLSALFAGLAWYDVFHRNRLELRPLIDFHTSGGESVSELGISIENAGPSATSIEWVKFYLDREERNLDDALREWGLDPTHDHGAILDDSPLAVGRVVWLVDYRAESPEERKKLIDLLGNHLAAEAKYCSVTDDCWTRCSIRDRC